MEAKKKLFVVMSMAVVLTLAVNSPASWFYWQGSVNDDWSNGQNWDMWWGGGGMWVQGYVPGAGDNVGVTQGSVVIYSGNQTCNDYSQYSNHGVNYAGEPGAIGGGAYSGNVTMTVKSGASFSVTPYNLDLGYFTGPGKVILNVEKGATVSAAGYFIGGRAGDHLINLAGTIYSSDSFGISGASIFDFASTGKLIITGDWKYYFDTYWSGTLVLDRGIGKTDPRWGTTYGINANYDAASNVTTITSIPEPVTMVLLTLGGLFINRKK